MKAQKVNQARTSQILPIEDLSGGLDLRSAPSAVKPNRARRLTNWSTEQSGALVVRAGWQRYTTTTIVVQG